MKKTIKLLLVLFPIMVIGQTQTENYIKNVIYKVPSLVAIPAPTTAQATQNTTYFDGLGRPIQQIAGQQSASGNDIITHIKYDGFGRQVEEYLPFKSSNTNMAFDPAAEANVLSYYGSPNPAINGNPAQEATTNPFSRKELEASPLNRILKQAAPGDDWKSGSGHEIKIDYQANMDSDEVRLYNANATWSSTFELYDITLSRGSGTGFYPAGQLYKTITYDENTAAAPTETNGSTVEFKNKEGQVVLKRTYSTVGSGTANEKHDTYYVYDIYGNLTYVIPPKAVDILNATNIQSNITSTAVVNSGITLHLTATNSIVLSSGFNAISGSTFSAKIDNSAQNTLDNLCYQYKYDNRDRLVEKKLPGKQWEFIVYDKLERPVATGPAVSPFNNMTTSGWNITKYDAFDRPVITAWLPNQVTAVARKSLQEKLNGFTDLSETKIAAATNTTVNGISFRYSSVVWPTADYHVLTVYYFDDYNYPHAPSIAATVANGDQPVYYNVTIKPKGLATGSWTRVLEASTAYRNELAYTLYDAKARPVRSFTQNFLGGYTYTDSRLDDFSGKLQYSITKHKRLAADTELVTKDVFTYSDQDRLLMQTHQINGGTIELIAGNAYDELGQLISKKVGNTIAVPIQKVDYNYNIRGWLKGINNIAALQQGTDPKDLFAFAINYNTSTSGITDVKPLYNGNISETYWATNSDNGIIRNYGYKYDNLNRLREGIYKKGTVLNSYNESMDYDKNGNIMHLKRYGSLDDNTQTLIDNLTYDYKNNNTDNQLGKVTDGVVNNANFKDEFKDSAANVNDDFDYDTNGNMTKDNNKNVIEIKYNHLDQPTTITFASTGNIVYIYNAVGQKVQKTVTDGVNVTIIDYLIGYQYSNTTLKFFPTDEGYVEPVANSYKYIYQYKDHLGNVRLSYDKTLAIQEENNYYPFGLKQAGYNNISPSSNDALKYKYNGKELQDDNIGGKQLNLYNYEFRQYMPDVARFTSIDPMADFVNYQSPYVMSDNNPIMNIDEDGLGILNVIGNLFRRLKNGIINIACSSCNPHREENLSKSWRDPDFGWYESHKGSGRRYESHTPLKGISLNSVGFVPHDDDIDNPNINIHASYNPPKPGPPPPPFRKKFYITTRDIQFKQNSNDLNDVFSKKTLSDLIKTLVDYPHVKVLISGNVTLDADDAKKVTLDFPKNATYINGKETSIRGLMLSRANAIKRFLLSKGVKANQISTGSGVIKTEGNMNATFKLTR